MSEEKKITLTEKEFINKIKAAILFGGQWSHGRTKVSPIDYAKKMWDELPDFLKEKK